MQCPCQLLCVIYDMKYVCCVVLRPRLATVARGVFPCPRLATNASADSRLRLQLCRLASAQLTVFPQLTNSSKQAVAYCWHSPAWLFLV
jgi:hypothetical protein